MSMNPRAYFSFKTHADISRTLAKNNFKPKVQTGIDIRKDEVIRMFDLEKSNKRRIGRMRQHDLEELRKVSKERYRIELKRLNHIVDCQKNGTSQEQVKEMLDELAETCKPDEMDIMLADTVMRSTATMAAV